MGQNLVQLPVTHYPKSWTACRYSLFFLFLPDLTLLAGSHSGRAGESTNEVTVGDMIGQRRRASDRWINTAVI
jgi:hypothetical protein